MVLSAGTWNGNLGQIAGADAKCLSDLTGNDWLNKAYAVSRGLLISAKVKAFLCTSNSVASCNNALPHTTYTFAASGAPSTGGAQFVTDDAGRGPGNAQNWAGTNYFGGDARYWANRGTSTAELWAASGQASFGTAAVCGQFDTTVGNGNTGNANNANGLRWQSSTLPCSNAYHLICMVHP